MRLFLMVCSHLKYQRLHGLYLKITVVSKRMCKVFLEGFIRSGCHFRSGHVGGEMRVPDDGYPA